MSRCMVETPDEAEAQRQAENAALEQTRGTDIRTVGFISIEDLEVLCHLADDRLLAMSGAKERMLGADAFGELVRRYLTDREQPDVAGNMGLARAKLMMGIVDGLRSFTRTR
jgi:DNA recombination-dependent growth factor C